jgi:hypothetical protein
MIDGVAMIKYEDLTYDECLEIYNKAFTFMHNHSEHVHNSFNSKTPEVAPSGSDLFKPELWKGIHWRWFIYSDAFTAEELDRRLKDMQDSKSNIH